MLRRKIDYVTLALIPSLTSRHNTSSSSSTAAHHVAGQRGLQPPGGTLSTHSASAKRHTSTHVEDATGSPLAAPPTPSQEENSRGTSNRSSPERGTCWYQVWRMDTHGNELMDAEFEDEAEATRRVAELEGTVQHKQHYYIREAK